MAETISMPKLGFDMAEGTLVRWVKTGGETVNKGEVLAEIETDKATVEVESSFSGVARSTWWKKAPRAGCHADRHDCAAWREAGRSRCWSGHAGCTRPPRPRKPKRRSPGRKTRC